MCSFLVQIVYGVCMVVTLILTIVSIALNAWSTAGEAGNSIGLFCPDLDAALVDAAAGKNVCKISFDVFDTLPGKVKAIFACLILAIIMEVVCLAYNLFTAFACCCKSILLYVLLAFTLFTVVMLGIVVGVSAGNNPGAAFSGVADNMKDAANAMGTGNAGALKDQVGPGKSFFMVVVALVTAIIDTVVCGIAIFCAKKAI